MTCPYCGDAFHFGKWMTYIQAIEGRLYFCSFMCKTSWINGTEEAPTDGELIHEGSLLRQDDEILEDCPSFFA